MSRHPLRDTWDGIMQRCRNPAHASYANYGAKGIDVCERWSNFAVFCGDMGDRPLGHSVERIDNSLGYSPSNCRWATAAEQTANRRTTIWVSRNGEKVPMSVAARDAGILPATVHYRIRKLGMTPDEALSLPINRMATIRAARIK